MEQQTGGSRFARLIPHLIAALRQLGGSASPSEAKAVVVKSMNLTDEELQETRPNGTNKVFHEMDWCRYYLAQAGMLESSTRGVWTLTEAGKVWDASAVSIGDLLRKVRATQRPRTSTGRGRSSNDSVAIEEVGSETPPDESTHRITLRALLRALPPRGFENLCQALLRELGFSSVVVTGRSGDGGIDGEGLLQVNPVVSFKVVFQCKRYSRPVGPEVIRDLRGAMIGRAEKGIILTTADFTSAAQVEAVRPGGSQIELVDGERLLDLFERLQLGLKPRTVFDVDPDFFRRFQSDD